MKARRLCLGVAFLGLVACGEEDSPPPKLKYDLPHEVFDGRHGGITAVFKGGDTNGYLELKLHDDKGDLEIYLGTNEKVTEPFDLPLDATVEIEFADYDGRKVTLRPRDRDQNMDERGIENIRNGMTNYFVFPTQDGEDASWLVGVDFQSLVVVRFSLDGAEFATEGFVLAPHIH